MDPWYSQNASSSRVGKDEVVELVLLVAGHLASGREEREQQVAEVVGAHAVEVVLAFAA